MSKLLAAAGTIALGREGQSVSASGKRLSASGSPVAASGTAGDARCQARGRDPGCQPGRSHEWSNRSLQWFELRNSAPMGEVIVLDPGLNVPGLVSALVSLLAMAIYAINQAGKENDDDDSSPGGGLMQPTT